MKPIVILPLTNDPTESEIQHEAYRLWLEGGCREGFELDNWFAAKERLIHHHGRARDDSSHSNRKAPPRVNAPRVKNALLPSGT